MAKREMKTTVDEQETVVNEQTDVVEPKTADEKPVFKYRIDGCEKLRIRKKPGTDSEVVCIIDKTTKLAVKELDGNKDWVKVTTDSGKKGFCMKKFVTIK